MNRNIIIAILGICMAVGVGFGLYNLPENPEIPPEPIIDNNETEVIIIDEKNDTDIIVDNTTVVVENQTEEPFSHNFSKFTLLK
jgi:hypothetical protein